MCVGGPWSAGGGRRPPAAERAVAQRRTVVPPQAVPGCQGVRATPSIGSSCVHPEHSKGWGGLRAKQASRSLEKGRCTPRPLPTLRRRGEGSARGSPVRQQGRRVRGLSRPSSSAKRVTRGVTGEESGEDWVAFKQVSAPSDAESATETPSMKRNIPSAVSASQGSPRARTAVRRASGDAAPSSPTRAGETRLSPDRPDVCQGPPPPDARDRSGILEQGPR